MATTSPERDISSIGQKETVMSTHNPYATELSYRYATLAEAARALAQIIHKWQLLDHLQEIADTSEEESRAASVDYELAKIALATVYEDTEAVEETP